MLLKRFWSSRTGNFAMMFGVAIIPVVLGAGVAVDYSRMLRAKGHLQAMADAAALSLASSRIDDQGTLEKDAGDFVQANFDDSIMSSVEVTLVKHEGDSYEVKVAGHMPTTFMSIANISRLDVATSAVAIRGVTGSVEVALVLDNTWSMSDTDGSGTKKIEALKSSAKKLVQTLHADEDAQVRIAVVPYADYVNVGTANRYQSWVSVPADYSTSTPKTCTTSTTKSTCTAWAPKTTCTRTVDGVEETYSCGGGCTASTTETVPEYETCSGGYTTNYTWYGCVGSRTSGTLRLSDDQPSVAYPGYLATSQRCPSPVISLTDQENSVLNSIEAMVPNVGGYKPYTYIPAGLVWGLNMLSPSVPFTDGKAYDPDNKNPRKVVVLMTDGENTLRFRNTDGGHIAYSGTATQQAAQAQQTLDDSLSLCSNIKAKNIEVFSVAFAVDSDDAKSLLETCASDPQHYFDAGDAVALDASFQQIADALTNVRLAR